MLKRNIETTVVEGEMPEMQAAIPVDTCIPYDIERTVSVVLSQRPFMESIVRPFAALFMEKAFVSSALR